MTLRKHQGMKKITEMLECSPDDDSYNVAVMLLASLRVGSRNEAVAKYTGLSKAVVSKYGRNLRRSDIWTRDGKVDAADWFGPNGSIEFGVAVCCGIGWLDRKVAA